jgi:peptide-methionine (R)-S-oxide reductase
MRKQPTRISLLTGLAALAVGIPVLGRKAMGTTTTQHFRVNHNDEEWRKRLTPEQYQVLRRRGTEAPGSSPFENDERKGTYLCIGCDQELFSSQTKFHSGSGWPSFYEPLPHAVETAKDYDLIVPRVEVHCSRCGGHLGHVFDDGPKPTGLRYCINGVVLKFDPAKASG